MAYMDDMNHRQLQQRCAVKMLCAACHCIESETQTRLQSIHHEVVDSVHEMATALITHSADIWPEYTREPD